MELKIYHVQTESMSDGEHFFYQVTFASSMNAEEYEQLIKKLRNGELSVNAA